MSESEIGRPQLPHRPLFGNNILEAISKLLTLRRCGTPLSPLYSHPIFGRQIRQCHLHLWYYVHRRVCASKDLCACAARPQYTNRSFHRHWALNREYTLSTIALNDTDYNTETATSRSRCRFGTGTFCNRCASCVSCAVLICTFDKTDTWSFTVTT